MKAVVKTAPEAGAVEIEDRDVPTPRPNEVIIAVKAAGICGTDRHIFHWDPSVQFMKPPVVFGHEFCGHVAAVGAACSDLFSEGEYVSAEMHVVCNRCYQCRTGRSHLCRDTKILGLHEDGCFADYVRVPASNVLKLPESIPPKVGGFLDALGNAVHTALSADIAGKRVAVMGCGPIGAMTAAVVDFCGGAHLYLTDVSDQALARTQRWADSRPKGRATPVTVLDMRGDGREAACQAMLDSTGDGVDVVLEISGAEPAINDAFRVVRPGGSVRLLGLTSKRDIVIENYSRNLVFKGLDVQGIIGRKMYDTWFRTLNLLQGGLDVEGIVTAEHDLARFPDAMDQFDRGDAWKVVVYPQGKE